jgi:hypothetical protein
MAVRTVSPLARSIGASAQIGRSERDRLQVAVKKLEKDLASYSKTQQRRTKQKGRWKILRKIGEGLTTVGALTGNPVLAGIGLAVTSGGGAGEGVMSQTQVKGAKGIKTGAADPLSDLLFVGRTARDVRSGAEEYRGGQVGAFQAQYEKDVVDIGFSVLKSMVGAGQAGTFGGTPYTPAGAGVDGTGADVLTQDIETYAKVGQEAGGSGIQGFLTKPIIPYGPPPGEKATAMEKYLYESRKMATPSYGSLAGGVSPYEQQVFGEPLSKYIVDPLSAKFRGGIDSDRKLRGSIGSGFKFPDWKMPKLRLPNWQSQQTQTYSSPFYSSGGDVLPPHGRGYK